MTPPGPSRWERWLSAPRWGWVAAGLAVLLCLPALGNGFAMDDHFLRTTVLGLGPAQGREPPAWDLFRFARGRLGEWQFGLELGVMPWWTPEDLVLGFWRPLASLGHWAELRAFPDAAWAMHLHSLVWLAACVLAVGALFRRIESEPVVAGLATLIFAVDDAHATPAGWIANRNALMATCFAALALIAHDRWRRDGWRPGAILGPLALLAGLWSGEIALGALGLLLAHALFFERELRARLVALAPSVVLVVGWRIAYVLLGFGARGSGLYVDPASSPLAYLEALVGRLPLLAFAQLVGPTSDFWAFSSSGVIRVMTVVAVAGLALVGWGAWRLLRADQQARFWLVGMVLALVPAAATFPNDRLLVIAGIGGAGFVARALVAWRRGLHVGRALGSFFVLAHLVVSPLALPPRVATVRLLSRLNRDSMQSVPDRAAGRTLVVVNVPDALLCMQLFAYGASIGGTIPARVRCLGATRDEVKVVRRDEHTLELEPARPYFGAPLDSLVRAADRGFAVGDRVESSSHVTTVLAVGQEGRPARVEFRFGRALESDELVWITWSGKSFREFAVPPVSESVTLPAFGFHEML